MTKEITIQYKTIEGVPGQYFDCPYGCGTLVTTTCANLYKEAMSPIGLKEGRRITCRSCPIGAHHAGLANGFGSSSRFLGSSICTRCHGYAKRLIRGSICVSCYNREREVLIGRNAKGSKPVFCRNVYNMTLLCIFYFGLKTEVRRMERVSSVLEAVLSVLRTSPNTCWFGWVGRPPTGE